MIQLDDIHGCPRVVLAQVGLEPALPVRVPERDSRRGDNELPWDEKVVGHRIGSQMCEVTECERSEPIGISPIIDFLTDMPRMAVPPNGRVFLRDRRIGSDAAVEEVVGERA